MGEVLAAYTGPEAILTEGRADSDPIAPNTTPEGREMNRRTEILVLTDPRQRLNEAGITATPVKKQDPAGSTANTGLMRNEPVKLFLHDPILCGFLCRIDWKTMFFPSSGLSRSVSSSGFTATNWPLVRWKPLVSVNARLLLIGLLILGWIVYFAVSIIVAAGVMQTLSIALKEVLRRKQRPASGPRWGKSING